MENEATVKSNTLILDVIKTIENTEKRIAVVISNNNKVLGTITYFMISEDIFLK